MKLEQWNELTADQQTRFLELFSQAMRYRGWDRHYASKHPAWKCHACAFITEAEELLKAAGVEYLELC